MAWRIEYADTAKKSLAKLDRTVAKRITAFLAERVLDRAEPRSIGGPLKGSRLGNYWRYRIGGWRVVCDIQDERLVVLVVLVGNRREVYD